MSIVYIMSK